MPQSNPITEAHKRANQKHLSKFVEIKVRVSSARREEIKQHAANMGESTAAFMNRAIAEAIERDTEKTK